MDRGACMEEGVVEMPRVQVALLTLALDPPVMKGPLNTRAPRALHSQSCYLHDCLLDPFRPK